MPNCVANFLACFSVNFFFLLKTRDTIDLLPIFGRLERVKLYWFIRVRITAILLGMAWAMALNFANLGADFFYAVILAHTRFSKGFLGLLSSRWFTSFSAWVYCFLFWILARKGATAVSFFFACKMLAIAIIFFF